MGNKNRYSNIDLLRIVAMLFIIIHHLIINGIGWTDITSNNIADNYSLCVIGGGIESFVIIGVNLFLMISGYFQIHFAWKKWLKLFLTLYVYMFCIQLFGIIIGYQQFNMEVFKRIVLPFELYWYLKVYMVLMLVSPILNRLIEGTNERIAKYFLLVFFVVFCLYCFLDNSEHLGFGRGYSFLSACCWYLLGALIKKGLIFYKGNWSKKKCMVIYLIAALVNTIGIQLAINILHSGKLAGVLLVYNNPLVAIETIFLFLFFAKLQINENSRYASLIKYLGQNTLAVYILHSSNRVLNYYRDIPLQGMIESNQVILAYIFVFIYAVVIFVICTFIDKLYEKTLGRIIGLISSWVGNLLTTLQEKLIDSNKL